jgi:ribosomal protein S18 acetylase RimI-like enzyme
MKCHYCRKDALYMCSSCGKFLCEEHTHLRTTCSVCLMKTKLEYSIERANSKEKMRDIGEFVRKFWGEEEQLMFDLQFKVTELPAYVAKLRNSIVGFISFAEVRNAIIIATLGVLPQYQGSGLGKGLLEKVEKEAIRTRKKTILVSTSNDNLPALAFYQSAGFQLYEVKPNAIANKHGKIISGISSLPVRDELRLQKRL